MASVERRGSAAAAEQLAAVRKERAQAFHGIPERPVDVGIRVRRGPAAHGADERLFQAQLNDIRAARRRGFFERCRGTSRAAGESAPSATTAGAGRTAAPGVARHEEEARRMLTASNCVRARAGCENLVWNSRLASIAQRAAERMARREVPFSHCGACERFAEYPLGEGATYGENLARSEGVSPLADAVVRGWEDSPGHLRNLTGPFSACGVGAASDEAGVCFVVQLLALLPASAAGNEPFGCGPHSPAPAPSASSPTAALAIAPSGQTALLGLVAVMCLLAWKGGWFVGSL